MGAGFQRLHQALAHARIGKAFGHGADAFQRFAIFRRMGGDLAQGFILQHPASGNVARLGFAFAPGGDGRQQGEEFLAGTARLEPLPGILWVLLIKRGVLQRRNFFGDPAAAAGLFQPGLHPFIDHPQMGDVGQGIFQLALG